MNNADLIVATLRRSGVVSGFGIPSGNVLPVMEAMRSGGIEFVLTAHEGSAAFAADVVGRMTGAPGLAIATLGPGATNLTTGVGCAFLDRSPMIALTCNLESHQLGRRIQMGIDHQALFRPITKGSFSLREGEVGSTVQAAVRLALEEPQGPVHLDLPEDVALAPATERVVDPSPPRALPGPDEAALEKAVRLLAQARRPVVVIGSSAMRMHDPSALLRVLEAYRVPFATTTMAKGLVDEGHWLSVGCIERARRQTQRRFLQSADLIVGLGYDTVEVEYEAWIDACPLLHIDIQAPDVAETVVLRHQVVGNLDLSVAFIADKADAGSASSWTEEEIAKHRTVFQRELRPAVETFAPYQAIDVAREVLPGSGVLAFDVGAHTHQIASQWQVPAPRSFLITNGWSSMGFGLPAAIAAKLVAPDRPVMCILGDGCFQMTCGELATAKRLGLSIPVIVLDDRWLGLIKVKQERRQLAYYGTELQPEPYQDPPSHYFGVPAFGVRSPSALREACRLALRTSGPTVIEAVVDPAHYSETVFD